MHKTYHPLSVALHWIVGLLIIGAFILALSIPEVRGFSPEKVKITNWHKWAGIAVLFFAVVRVFARLVLPAPPLPSDVLARMPLWQHTLHRLTIVGMLILSVLIPFSGWMMSSAAGYPVVWLGMVPLPDLIGKDPELARNIREVHGLMAWTLAALVGLHIAASMKHHFMDKDSVLARMLPWTKR